MTKAEQSDSESEEDSDEDEDEEESEEEGESGDEVDESKEGAEADATVKVSFHHTCAFAEHGFDLPFRFTGEERRRQDQV